MEVVSKEQASKEVNEWLDFMDVTRENREKESVKPFVDSIIDSVSKGYLTFGADGIITQKLKFPLGDGATKELKYDFRFEIGEYNQKTKGISPTDEVDYAVARLSLVSEQKHPASVFLKMKRADYNIASKLTVFF